VITESHDRSTPYPITPLQDSPFGKELFDKEVDDRAFETFLCEIIARGRTIQNQRRAHDSVSMSYQRHDKNVKIEVILVGVSS